MNNISRDFTNDDGTNETVIAQLYASDATDVQFFPGDKALNHFQGKYYQSKFLPVSQENISYHQFLFFNEKKNPISYQSAFRIHIFADLNKNSNFKMWGKSG